MGVDRSVDVLACARKVRVLRFDNGSVRMETPGEAACSQAVAPGGRSWARFDDYAGRFVFHCHDLEHEVMAMANSEAVLVGPDDHDLSSV